MGTKKNKTEDKKIVEHIFSGDLTLRQAAEVKENFAAAIASAETTSFSFAEVEEIDLSFIQILCSGHRTAHDAGKVLEFSGEWPESFINLINEAGLNDHVGCSIDSDFECPWLASKTC